MKRRSYNLFLAALSLCLASQTGLTAIDGRLSVVAKTPVTGKVPGEEAGKTSPFISELEEKLGSALKRNDAPEVADAYYQLGKAYYEVGANAPKAEEMFKLSMKFEDRAGRPDRAIQVRIALGHLLMAMKRSDEAMSYYNQALDKANETKQKANISSILDNMASVMLLSGELEKAEALLTKAYEIAVSENKPVAQANALINLAGVACARKQHEKGIADATKAIGLLGTSEEEYRTLGLAHRQLGRIYTQLGDYVRAVDEYQKAAKLFEEDVETVLRAQMMLSIGQIFLAQRRPLEAKEQLKQAIEVLKAEEDQRGLIECMVALGAAEADTANFVAAEKLHSDAIGLAVNRGDLRGQFMAAAESGFDYLLQGKTEQALSKFQQAQSLMDKSRNVSDADRGPLLRDLGLCYRSLGQTDAALKYYQEAAEAFKRAGDVQNEALLLNSIAVVYLDMGRKDDFEKQFALAKELASSGKGLAAAACLSFNYAQSQYMARDFEKAAVSYRETIERARACQDVKTEGMALASLGMTLLQLGRASEAKDCFVKSNQLAERIGVMELKWDACLGLGKSLRQTGDLKGAEEALRRAIALVETERSHLSRDTFKTFSLDQRQECFLELVDLLVSSQRHEEALEIAEKSRARAFLDLLEGRIRNLGGEVAARVIEGEGQAPTRPPSPNVVALGPQSSTVRSVQIKPKASTLVEASAVSTFNASPPNVAEIKDLVSRSKTQVVEYLILKDKLLAWVILPTGEIKLAPPVVIPANDLRRKVQELHDSIVKSSTNMKELSDLERRRQQLLRELHAILIEPIQPMISKDPDTVITFVPYGALFSVPFAALMSPEGRFLVENHTIAYLPAVGVLRATEKLAANSREHKEDTLLAFGNPITQVIAFLGALPFSEKEVRKVAALFGPEKAIVQTGAAATRGAFRSRAASSSVIHLATHGLINEERPMDSALVLAPDREDDGLLTVKDILQLPPLKARLVVLSACQTGRGKITGDGVVGLSRAFIIAGSPSVVVSQWNVDDLMTEFQMEHFYKSLLSGASRARALREAQLKTIAYMEAALKPANPHDSVRANPRLWSAFELIGDHQ